MCRHFFHSLVSNASMSCSLSCIYLPLKRITALWPKCLGKVLASVCRLVCTIIYLMNRHIPSCISWSLWLVVFCPYGLFWNWHDKVYDAPLYRMDQLHWCMHPTMDTAMWWRHYCSMELVWTSRRMWVLEISVLIVCMELFTNCAMVCLVTNTLSEVDCCIVSVQVTHLKGTVVPWRSPPPTTHPSFAIGKDYECLL